jgi:hypothetical protein
VLVAAPPSEFSAAGKVDSGKLAGRKGAQLDRTRTRPDSGCCRSGFCMGRSLRASGGLCWLGPCCQTAGRRLRVCQSLLQRSHFKLLGALAIARALRLSLEQLASRHAVVLHTMHPSVGHNTLHSSVCMARSGAVAGEALQQARRSLNYANVVILMADAQVSLRAGGGLSKRELTLAAQIVREGRAILIALNKLDLLTEADQQRVCPCPDPCRAWAPACSQCALGEQPLHLCATGASGENDCDPQAQPASHVSPRCLLHVAMPSCLS